MRVTTPFLLAAAAALAAGPSAAYEPTSRYTVESCHGFKILVGPELRRHPTVAGEARRLVEAQVLRLARQVPAETLAKLRATRIWIEWDSPCEEKTIAQFYPGKRCVKDLGLNPDKANGVEVPNARRFIAAYDRGVTWTVMHELAHAYHWAALMGREAKIKAAHKQAVERRLYDDVEHVNGVRARGYAVTNHWEYFATLSESYFGKSSNYPYDRDGLKRHDTVGYWLMKEMWGDDS